MQTHLSEKAKEEDKPSETKDSGDNDQEMTEEKKE